MLLCELLAGRRPFEGTQITLWRTHVHASDGPPLLHRTTTRRQERLTAQRSWRTSRSMLSG